MENLRLSQIHFGETDARHEYLCDLRDQTHLFQGSFLLPKQICINNFHERKYYYVSGLKGTGKTALLQYVFLDARNRGYEADFISFFSEFDEGDLWNLSRATFTLVRDNNEIRGNEPDYEALLTWFLHQRIFECLTRQGQKTICEDENFSLYKKLLDASSSKTSEHQNSKYQNLWRSLIQKVKRGRIRLRASLGSDDIAKIGAEFESSIEGTEENLFTSLGAYVRALNEILSRMRKNTNNLFIYLDELDISYDYRDKYERDCRIIRDLIIAISDLNEICIVNNVPIFFIAAVRSEVLRAVETLGKQINKLTADFGLELTWWGYSTRQRNPLLAVVANKIRASEEMVLGKSSGSKAWDKYFPRQLHGRTTRKRVLELSWYRPRDLVRLLTIARALEPDARRFTQASGWNLTLGTLF